MIVVDAHFLATSPAMAPSTIVTDGLMETSAAACPMKVSLSQGKFCAPVWQSSSVVFDIPIPSRTIFPLGSGAPLVSSGWILAATVNPSLSCWVGMVLLALGYRPPEY